MEEQKNFFISYNKADRQWAKWIAGTLENEGYKTIIQAWDFRKSGNFVLDMQDALVNTERFIAVLTENYIESPYCRAEWAAAFNDDPDSKKRKVVNVRVSDIKPEGLFSVISYIDLFGIEDETEAEKRIIQGVDLKYIPRNRPKYPGQTKVNFPGRQPIHNIPHHRNIYFTGRDGILDDIHKRFTGNGYVSLTQTISGLGGVGKTQVALEYAYRYAFHYDIIWWINAETQQTMLEDIIQFVNRMQPGRASSDHDDIMAAFNVWLDENKNWLLIYDNADDMKQVSKSIPKINNGHILITTRNKHGLIGDGINIDLFEENETVDFLYKRTRQGEQEAAVQLSKRLGYLPLALEQAAAYISENGINYSDYLDLLDGYGLELLGEKEYITSYSAAVTTTWNISIDKIESESAKQLIRLCSYFAPEDIKLSYFTQNSEWLPIPLKDDIIHGIKCNKVVSELTKYSLMIKKDKSLYMHRLLQEVIRRQLSDDAQWILCCLSIMAEVYEYQYGNVTSNQLFFKNTPHAITVADYAAKLLHQDKEQDDVAYLYYIAGLGFYHTAAYSQSMEWFRKALAIHEEIIGKEHPNTATTYHNIASAYSALGNYPAALEWYWKALAIQVKVLGKEHPNTATTYYNIAGVYSEQGDYPAALEWYWKALAIQEKVLGKEHPDTANTYNNIARAYFYQGGYPAALEWYRKALAIQEKVLGKEHPNTATTYNNIAGVYSEQGDYPAALEWYRKALAITEKVLGKEHPDTAITYNNIALVYSFQGDYPTALEWYRKDLAITEKVLGKEHPSTANTYNNIALVYSFQGDYPTALEWYRKSLAIKEKVLGKEHPRTATTYYNIAGVYSELEDYPAALEWYWKALAIQEKTLGKEHPDTATSYNNIASVYSYQGDYPAALGWNRKALGIREKVLGKEHPDTAISYNNIALVYSYQGDYPASLEWYRKALAIQERVLGKEHPDSASSYYNIAVVYSNQGNYPAALEWYQKAKRIFERVLGIDHPYTKIICDNMKKISH